MVNLQALGGNDAAAFVIALLLLVARHAWTIMRGTEGRETISLRAEWVRRLLRQPGLEILAVQTLRNSIMAATVMASTSAIGLMGVVGLGQFRNIGSESALGAFDVIHVKLFLPLALLAGCVVLFSKASRLYHRCGYLMGLSKGASEMYPIAEREAIDQLTRAAFLYRHGWRLFYTAIATGAWLVNGWLALVTTLVLIAIDILAKVE